MRDVAFTPDGDYLVSGGDDRNLVVSGTSGHYSDVLHRCNGRINCLTVGADGAVAAGDRSGNLHVLFGLSRRGDAGSRPTDIPT